MEFEWDEAKNATNKVKHGVDFALSRILDWDKAVIAIDERFDYGEDRFLARGFADDGVGYSIVFTFRGPTIRVISIRQFNKKEERLHGQEQ